MCQVDDPFKSKDCYTSYLAHFAGAIAGQIDLICYNSSMLSLIPIKAVGNQMKIRQFNFELTFNG